jgi:hypothetical protein
MQALAIFIFLALPHPSFASVVRAKIDQLSLARLDLHRRRHAGREAHGLPVQI